METEIAIGIGFLLGAAAMWIYHIVRTSEMRRGRNAALANNKNLGQQLAEKTRVIAGVEAALAKSKERSKSSNGAAAERPVRVTGRLNASVVSGRAR